MTLITQPAIPSFRSNASPLKIWSTRVALFGGALFVNVALFGLMPFLMIPGGDQPDKELPAVPVQLIRLQPPEPPMKKIVEKPPPPPPKPQTEKPQAPKASMAKLSLPFSLNPRLPALQSDISLPLVPGMDPGGLDEIFSVGELDSPLTILVRIPPVYPIAAKRRGVEGWVRVRFIVNEDGSVSNITIAESEPLKLFDDAVIRSVSGWRFKAGTIGGMAVRTQAETVVRFHLD